MRIRVWSLALLSGLKDPMLPWYGLNLVLLELWCRQAAAAPIQPLAWELPYATGAAIKKIKKKKKKRKKEKKKKERKKKKKTEKQLSDLEIINLHEKD